jgi:uncharacterized YccA/Bax inhibitor family protein
MFKLESSNPALSNQDAFSQFYGKDMFAAKADVTTLQGVINKTALLVGVAIAAGAVGYGVFASFPQVMWISGIASLVICLGIGWKLCRQPALAKVLGPIYAVVEGVFLGAFTAVADTILANRGITVAGGVGVQAFIVTAACMISMLLLYKTGIVRPTETLKAVLSVATIGIMLAYLASFILSLFWQPLPLISFASAVQDQGAMGFIGLGVNILILGIASLWLVIDFGTIEENIKAGAPKSMEWYCAFGLLVSLAWIYLEAVKLVVRVATLFGSRD